MTLDDHAVVDITRSITLFIGSEKACRAFKRKHYNEYSRVIKRK